MLARRRLAPLVLCLTLAAACGADTTVAVEVVTPTPGEQPDPTATAAPEPTPTESPQPTVEPTPEPEPTATEVPAEPTATAEPTAVPDLPGEPFDFLVPVDGEIVAVVGVAYDDILEMHAQPGEATPLVGELPNLADDVIGTGQGRQLPSSIWWLVEWNGIEGWVGSAFMARIGATIDFTNDFITMNGGSGLGAETMLDLGLAVADVVASDEPPSRIAVVVAPDAGGDLGEVTVDVVGLGDDALTGYRLHIFGEPAEIADEGFQLRSIEATLLCTRGVSEDGLCL